jgi:hypothetical protein
VKGYVHQDSASIVPEMHVYKIMEAEPGLYTIQNKSNGLYLCPGSHTAITPQVGNQYMSRHSSNGCKFWIFEQ